MFEIIIILYIAEFDSNYYLKYKKKYLELAGGTLPYTPIWQGKIYGDELDTWYDLPLYTTPNFYYEIGSGRSKIKERIGKNNVNDFIMKNRLIGIKLDMEINGNQ